MRINRKIWIIPLTVLGLALAGPGQATAETAAGVEFPEQTVISGVPLQLQGTGVKTVAFIKAFAAAFYREPGADLDRAAKKIVVEYFVRIPAAKLTRFTIDSMRDNVSPRRMEELSDDILRMGQLFVDLEPGDQFALAYVPGEGTHFLHNGQLTGTIPGQEFAEALYAVWIGEKPFDEKLKRSILGQERPKSFLPLFAQSR